MEIIKVSKRCLAYDGKAFHHCQTCDLADCQPGNFQPNLHQLLNGFAANSDCKRKQVGTVLLGEEFDFLAGGFNHGANPCGPLTCTGESGECRVTHSEMDALSHLLPGDQPRTALVSYSPCWDCLAALYERGVKQVFYLFENRFSEQMPGLVHPIPRAYYTLKPR